MTKIQTTRNHLLLQLPEGIAQALLRRSDVMQYDYKQVICIGSSEIEHVDFPETGVISLLQKMDGNSAVEIVNVGNEGMLNSALLTNTHSTTQTAVCQVEGTATRFAKKQFLNCLDTFPQLREICQRYTTELFERTAKSFACSKMHSHQERCAAWILSCHSRCASGEFYTTQRALADLLGCTRTAVNSCASDFQEAGLIKYSRGTITVLDIARLKRLACKCLDYASKENICK